jgi:hypothetical protein
MTPAQAVEFVACHGIVCEVAHRGTIPVLVEAVAGEELRGNWWSHPRSREIFAATRAVRESPHFLVCRLVDGRISFVHERLWPALVCAAGRFPAAHLARLREVHDSSGKHIVGETPFSAWVPAAITALARRMSEQEAIEALQAVGMLQTFLSPRSRRKSADA